jgi:hypothetical protein
MNRVKQEVTSPELDCGLVIGLAVVLLVIALVPPYGFHHHTAYFGAGAAVNFFSGWRLYRKISITKITMRPPKTSARLPDAN